MGWYTFSLLLLIVNILHINGAAITEQVTCPITHLDDVPVEPDFDVDQFAGIWYVHATTTFRYGDETRQSPIRKIELNIDTESINIGYAGYDAKLEECVTGAAPGTSQHGKPGSYRYPQRGVTTKYVYTDYQYAVAFICFDENGDEVCENSEKRIEVWSKSIDTIPGVVFLDLKTKAVEKLCIQLTDLKETELGLCQPSIFTQSNEVSNDNCASSPCQHGGVCVQVDNGHRCDCMLGWTGVNCETNIDDCVVERCQNGGSCIDLINDFNCICDTGYTGELCEEDFVRVHVTVQSSTSILVTLESPPDVAEHIHTYHITYQVTGRNEITTLETTTLPYTLSGLRKFTEYSVSLSFVDDVGAEINAGKQIVSTMSDVPSAPPQNVLLHPVGANSFSVTWGPVPVDEQNGVITKYQITVVHGRELENIVKLDADSRTYTQTGLTADTVYTVSMKAFTEHGSGPATQWNTVTTLRDASGGDVVDSVFESVNVNDEPGPVQNLHVDVLSSKSVHVTWEPPQVTISPITKYQIIYQIPGHNVETIVDTMVTEHTLTGLHKFTVYSLHVVAYNTNGKGQEVPEIIFRTQLDIPSGKPQNVALQALSSTSIRVTWYPPLLSEQNGQITGYSIVIRKSESCYATVHVNGSQRAYTFSHLNESTFYGIIVVPENKHGSGPGSPWKSVTTLSDDASFEGESIYDVPPSVQNIQAQVESSTSLHVSWDSPEITHSPVMGYQVVYSVDGEAAESHVETTTNTYILTGLCKFTRYNIKVRAYNGNGRGPLSTPVYATTLSDVPGYAPQNVTARDVTSSSMLITWNAPPLDEQNGIITSYRIIYWKVRSGETNAIIVRRDQCSYLFSDLEADSIYYFRVIAQNEHGRGPISQPTSAKTLQEGTKCPYTMYSDTELASSSNQPMMLMTSNTYTAEECTDECERDVGSSVCVGVLYEPDNGGACTLYMNDSLPSDVIQKPATGKNYYRRVCSTQGETCHLESVPPQEEFQQDQFLGLWYTVYKTTHAWPDDPWTSDARKFVKDGDGSVNMLLTAHNGVACTPVTVYKLSDFEHGSADLIVEDRPVIFKVLHTDYTFAVVYFCFEQLDDGTCAPDKHQIEITSREKNAHLPTEVETELLQWTKTNLCIASSLLTYVNQGLCEIPEILRHVLNDEAIEIGSTARVVTCKLDDLPVQKNFHLNQMTGLWYEIARTRFTFNTMESCIHYFEYDSGSVMSSQYTGTKDGVCDSALSSISKHRGPEYPAADLLSKIGDSESMFPWITVKIIYVDENYLMSYACYGAKEDGSCHHDKQELTLVGRTRHIDAETRQQITSSLSDYCISQDELVDTQFEANCTSFIQRDTSENAETDTVDERCLLTSLPVQHDFDVNQFVGDWHIIAMKKPDNLPEAAFVFKVARVHRRQGNGMRLQFKVDAGDSVSTESFLQPVCESSTDGDFIVSYSTVPNRQWASVKVLYTDYSIAVLYHCSRKEDNGLCGADVSSALLLSRNSTLTDEKHSKLISIVNSVCISPDSLSYVTDHVTELKVGTPEPEIVDSCALENIPLQPDFDFSKISGYWYEIAHSYNPRFMWNSGIIYYDTEGYRIGYAGAREDGTCMGPLMGDIVPRCPGILSADFLGALKAPGVSKPVPWKILYTDYTTVLVPYSCMLAQSDGSCAPNSWRLHILAREKTISAELRAQMNEIVTGACIDPSALLEVQHPGDCRSNIDSVFIPTK